RGRSRDGKPRGGGCEFRGAPAVTRCPVRLLVFGRTREPPGRTVRRRGGDHRTVYPETGHGETSTSVPLQARSTGISGVKNRVAEAVSENVESDAAWHERRDAVRELGAALRELVGAAVSTEVDTDTLLRTAEQARELAGPLTAATRTRTQRPSAEGEYSRDRLYNPAVGHGSP